jgi:autotransporter-associated beta strand protein
MTGSASSLGVSGTIVMSLASNLFLSTTAAAQTSDKALVLEWIYDPNITTRAAQFGLNGGPVGFNSAWGYGTRPMLNWSGPITAAAISGTNTYGFTTGLFTGTSGTISGLISEGANHKLAVTTNGANLTNPGNTFSGGFILGSGLPNGTYATDVLGTIGNASVIGSGTLITLNSATLLRYTGPGETSDKRFELRKNGGSNIFATLDASGSGELVLSNTAPISYSAGNADAGNDMQLRLGGTGRGTLAAYVTSTAAGIAKYDAGTWTLTGSNAVTSVGGYGGTLVFANRMSLLGGGTSNWVKSKVFTASGSAAVMAFRVGGAGEFTNDDVSLLLTSLGGDTSTGGMRSTSSWGFDTTNAGGTVTINDVIANTSGGSGGSAGGAIGVVKLGSGTLSLGGANTYTLGTEVRGGVLTIANNTVLGSGTGFLRFTGGTLDLAGFTVDRGGPMTATSGGLTNGVISGTTSLTKTGPGMFRIDATANTFTGAVAIQEGVVEAVVISGSGQASSLGSGTGASATINLGNLATGGTFRYVGSTSATTNRIFNLSGTTGGGGIEASGGGALVITSTVTAGTGGTKTLTLGGTSTAANAIGMIRENTVTNKTNVVKDGPGLWQLTRASDFTGSFTVNQGTIVAAADSTQTNGAFGANGVTDVLVGNPSGTATGQAAVLLAAGFNTTKIMNVQAGGGSQTVVLGGTGAGVVDFQQNVYVGRAVTLVADASGTTFFSGHWFGANGSGTPAHSVTFGLPDNTGVVSVLRGLATSGSVGVKFGSLNLGLTGTIAGAGPLAIDSGAALTGIGVVAGTLGGAGRVAPGNSPGILTAEAVDPTLGLDWDFEFTGTTINFGTASDSGNDLLRLTTTSTTPFTSALSADNVVRLYLPANVDQNLVYLGGFFTDSGTSSFTNFQSLISSGSFVAYYASGSSGAVSYNGTNYSLLSDKGWTVTVSTTTVASAGFSDGAVPNGQVTTFTVVPEPAAIALAAIGLGLAGLAIRRSRRAR